jgi:hypothetical protein
VDDVRVVAGAVVATESRAIPDHNHDFMQKEQDVSDVQGPFVVEPGDENGVDLPTVDHSDEQIQVWFNAEDSVNYSWDDVQQIYVDNHIANFSIQPDPGTLNVDDQQLTLTYESGEEYSLVLGTIAETGPGVTKYYQSLSQLIVAADGDLNPLFNGQTTPNLLRLRQALNQLMVEANQQRIEIGSIVYSFAKMIKSLTSSDMSDVLQEIKQQQNE